MERVNELRTVSQSRSKEFSVTCSEKQIAGLMCRKTDATVYPTESDPLSMADPGSPISVKSWDGDEVTLCQE